MKWRTFLTMILFSVFLAGNDGCKTTEDFRGRDRGVFFPSFRTSVDLRDSGEKDKDSQFSPRGKASGLKAEFDYVYGSGNSSQGLDPTEFMLFQGQRFNGPAEIQSDYDLYAFSAVLRAEISDPGTRKTYISLHPFLGIGAQQFRLKMSAQGVDVEERNRTYGPLVGIQLVMKPVSWMNLYGRFSGVLGFGEHVSSLGRAETAVAITPLKNFSLAVGWNWMNYQEDRQTEASIDARLSGPMVGVHLDF